MGYTVSPLPGRSDFGAVVTGLTPAMLTEDEVRTELHALWADRGLVLFRGVDGLDTQLALARLVGEPEDYPLLRGLDMPAAAKLSIEIDEKTNGLFEVDGERRGGWLGWHKDTIYTDRLSHGCVLWSIAVPARGGETGFIDQIAAWEAMPAALRARIDGLNVIYRYSRNSAESKFGPRPDRCISRDPRQAARAGHAITRRRAIHPMVFAQPGTGRRLLNLSPWFADGIEGMENDEGDALLRAVIADSTRPERAWFHKWQPGEMLLWDNWRMLHCSAGTPQGMRRQMRRVAIAGDYGLGRWEEAAA